jgi:hypothetical protein
MGVLRNTKRKAVDHHSLFGLLYKPNIAYFVSVGSGDNFTTRSLSERSNKKYPTRNAIGGGRAFYME